MSRLRVKHLVEWAYDKANEQLAMELMNVINRAKLHPNSKAWQEMGAGAEERLNRLPRTIARPYKIDLPRGPRGASRASVEHHFTTLDPEDDPGLAELQ